MDKFSDISIENIDKADIETLTAEGRHIIGLDVQKLSYEVTGAGHPLILMHGWGCSLETVKSIAQEASRTHKVFNIDLPGFGNSSEPSTVWGIEEYTALIERFVKALGLTAPVLAGHSFGGRISILFASRNRVDKVVLIDAAGVKPKRSLKFRLKIYSFKLAKSIVKILFTKKKRDEIIEKMRKKRGSADYQSASPMMRAILSKTVNEDLKSVMPSITAPTLLIWGAKDTATPVSDAKTMERLIKGSGLVIFDDAGHYSFLDNPYGFRAVLSSFLKS